MASKGCCNHGKCNHGKVPDNAHPDITVSGATERAVERHEARCRNAQVFWHPGTLLGIFKVICCAGCGKQVA